MKLLGWEIKREADNENPEDQPLSFADPLNDDGALTVGTALGGSYSVMLDIEGSAKTEAELVTKYRGMFLHAEIQQGVEEITTRRSALTRMRRSLRSFSTTPSCLIRPRT